MATDSKKTKGTTDPAESAGSTEATDLKTKEEDSAAPEEAEAVDDREATDDASGDTTDDVSDEDSLDLDDDPADADSAEARAKAASNTNVLAGAGALVSTALGLCSLTGTSLGEMMHSRKELIGQIEASASQGQGGGDQIEAFYGAPWHTAALLNGAFALIAVLIGGVLLALHAQRAETHSWVKAAALGGIILGAVGLLVSCGMYFDLFASQPELPEAPAAPPAG